MRAEHRYHTTAPHIRALLCVQAILAGAPTIHHVAKVVGMPAGLLKADLNAMQQWGWITQHRQPETPVLALKATADGRKAWEHYQRTNYADQRP